MGTKVQSQAQFPGYCSTKNQNTDMCNGTWDPYRKERFSENSEFENSFTRREVVDGYASYAKELTRQTILKQEMMFRDQLRELHRLYQKQRGLMEELARNSLAMQKDYTESKCITSQRTLFDLEQPADRDLNNERNHNIEKIQGNCLTDDYIGNPLRSTYYKKKSCNLADLNEPIQIEEIILSSSVNNSNSGSFPKDKSQRRDSSFGSKSGFWNSSQLTQSSHADRQGGICIDDRHLESDRKTNELLTYNLITGKSGCQHHASFRVNHPCDSHTPTNSFQVESRKGIEHSAFVLPDKIQTQNRGKRKLFGVEICEGKPVQSNDASHMLCSKTSISNDINSGSSLPSSWRNMTSSSGQNVLARGDISLLGSLVPSTEIQDLLTKPPDFLRGSPYNNSDSRSIPSSRGLGFYHSDSSLPLPSVTNNNNSATGIFEQPGPKEIYKGSGCVTLVPANNFILPIGSQNESLFQQTKSVNAARLPWINTTHSSVEKIKGKEVPYQMNLESLQNHAQNFFKKDGPTQVVASVSAKVSDKPADSKGVTKLLGFPIFRWRDISNTIVSPSSSKGSNNASVLYNENNAGAKSQDPEMCKNQEMKDSIAENVLNNYNSGLRHQFDLNLTLTEEEPVPAPSIPKAVVKIATTEIDLEVPAVLESDTDTSDVSNTHAFLLKMPSNSPLVDSVKLDNEDAKIAAEAIMEISSMPSNLLLWFAEISDYVSQGFVVVDGSCNEESIPEGMDEFEFMTLNLKETKEKEYCYKPAMISETEKDNVTAPKQSRKGQGKRSRRRKDFQRDILPSIVSLARREVTEDLHRLEAAFTTTGVSWQSSMSKKNAARNTRGKKRIVEPDPPVTNEFGTTPQEVAIQAKSLGGWGKRTKRLPRQRCPYGYPVPLKG